MSKKAKTDQLRAATGHAKSGQHITRITAHRPAESSDSSAPRPESTPPAELAVDNTGKTELAPVNPDDKQLDKPKKLTRAEKKAARLAQKQAEDRPIRTYFLLFRPFVAFGRYLRDSWREIRQVRWPNRKATWKMTLAVLVYCAIFMAFLLLLDALFTFVFELLLNKGN